MRNLNIFVLQSAKLLHSLPREGMAGVINKLLDDFNV